MQQQKNLKFHGVIQNFTDKYFFDSNYIRGKDLNFDLLIYKDVITFLKLLKITKLKEFVFDENLTKIYLKKFCIAQRWIKMDYRKFLILEYLKVLTNMDRTSSEQVIKQIEALHLRFFNSLNECNEMEIDQIINDIKNLNFLTSLDENGILKLFQFFLSLTLILLFNEKLDYFVIDTNFDDSSFSFKINERMKQLFCFKGNFKTVFFNTLMDLLMMRNVFSSSQVIPDKTFLFILKLLLKQFTQEEENSNKTLIEILPSDIREFDTYFFLNALRARNSFSDYSCRYAYSSSLDLNIYKVHIDMDEEENDKFNYNYKCELLANAFNNIPNKNYILDINRDQLDIDIFLDFIMGEQKLHINSIFDIKKIVISSVNETDEAIYKNYRIFSYTSNELITLYEKQKDNNNYIGNMIVDDNPCFDLLILKTNCSQQEGNFLRKVLEHLSSVKQNYLLKYVNKLTVYNDDFIDPTTINISMLNTFLILNEKIEIINFNNEDKIKFLSLLYNSLRKIKFEIPHKCLYLAFLLKYDFKDFDDYKEYLLSSNSLNIICFTNFYSNMLIKRKEFLFILFEKHINTLNYINNILPDSKLVNKYYHSIVNTLTNSINILKNYYDVTSNKIINYYCENPQCPKRKLKKDKVIFYTDHLYFCNNCQQDSLAFSFDSTMKFVCQQEEYYTYGLQMFCKLLGTVNIKLCNIFEMKEKYIKIFSLIAEFGPTIVNSEFYKNYNNMNKKVCEDFKNYFSSTVYQWKTECLNKFDRQGCSNLLEERRRAGLPSGTLQDMRKVMKYARIMKKYLNRTNEFFEDL